MPMRTRLASLLVAAALFVAGAPLAAHAQDPEPRPEPTRLARPEVSKTRPTPERDPNTVLVKYSKDAKENGRRRALGKHAASDAGAVRATGYSLVEIDGRPEDAVRDLEAEPEIADVALNFVRRASTVPNDPAYAFGDQDYLKQLRMATAWNASKGTTAKTIAILDTGIDTNHPEFTGRRRTGYNTMTNGTNVVDDNGHGTFVAGVAAAATNNGRGIAGAAWNAGILPVKVLDANGEGTDADVAEGITWAADHGASVINLSLGGPGSSPVLLNAVNYAVSKNIVVVAAAGNEGWDVKSFPAAYRPVLAVSATDGQSTFAYFSNHGWWIDVAAPGMGIISTMADSEEAYAVGDGTSFAAPIAAGVAFLLRVQNPAWSQAQITQRIRATSRDMGPRGIDPFYGKGRIDAAAALGAASALAPAVQPAGDALEPNSSLVRADVLHTSASSTISPEGDTDYFFHDVGAPGTVTFTVTPPATDPAGLRALEFDPILIVYGPGSEVLGSVDATFAGQSETLTVPATAAGRYSAAVSNYFGSRSPSSYTITVSTTVQPATSVSDAPLAWMRDIAPPDFGAGVPRTISPGILFGREIDPASVDASKVALLDGVTGIPVAAELTFDPVTNVARINPTSDLLAGRPYIVWVWLVRDTAGETLAVPITSRFVTA